MSDVDGASRITRGAPGSRLEILPDSFAEPTLVPGGQMFVVGVDGRPHALCDVEENEQFGANLEARLRQRVRGRTDAFLPLYDGARRLRGTVEALGGSAVATAVLAATNSENLPWSLRGPGVVVAVAALAGLGWRFRESEATYAGVVDQQG